MCQHRVNVDTFGLWARGWLHVNCATYCEPAVSENPQAPSRYSLQLPFVLFLRLSFSDFLETKKENSISWCERQMRSGTPLPTHPCWWFSLFADPHAWVLFFIQPHSPHKNRSKVFFWGPSDPDHFMFTDQSPPPNSQLAGGWKGADSELPQVPFALLEGGFPY